MLFKKKKPEFHTCTCPGCEKEVTRCQTIIKDNGVTWHLGCHQQQCDAEGLQPIHYEMFGINIDNHA